MATTSVRTATRVRLVDLLSAAPQLAGVQVAYGWAGQDAENESVYLGDTRGEVEVAAMKGGRKSRDDRFSFDLWIVAGAPGQDGPQAADERAEELYAVVEDVLAGDPELGRAVPGLVHAVLGDVDGPTADPTDEGWASLIRAEVRCWARLL